MGLGVSCVLYITEQVRMLPKSAKSFVESAFLLEFVSSLPTMTLQLYSISFPVRLLTFSVHLMSDLIKTFIVFVFVTPFLNIEAPLLMYYGTVSFGMILCHFYYCLLHIFVSQWVNKRLNTTSRLCFLCISRCRSSSLKKKKNREHL